MATDLGHPQLQTTFLLHVNIVDGNDNAPVFVKPVSTERDFFLALV